MLRVQYCGPGIRSGLLLDLMPFPLMPCSVPTRVLVVALCFVSITIVFESLLVRELSSCVLCCSNTFRQISVRDSDVLVKVEDHASVLLRAIRACSL